MKTIQLEKHLFGPAGRPMLSVCPVSGCNRLTMGGTCVEHDEPVTMTFPRGRPFVHDVPIAAADQVVAAV